MGTNVTSAAGSSRSKIMPHLHSIFLSDIVKSPMRFETLSCAEQIDINDCWKHERSASGEFNEE